MRTKLFIAVFGMFFGITHLSNSTPISTSISDCCKKVAACCEKPSNECCAKGDQPSDKKARKKNAAKTSAPSTTTTPVKRSGSVFGKRYTC